MSLRHFLTTLCLLIVTFYTSWATEPKSTSVYQKRLDDPQAVYFTPDNFKIKADGKVDVSDELQEAIREVKTKYDFGIVFIPEGTYLITKTIYIPSAIRLIGYGKNRPLVVLGKNSPGFQVPDSTDKGRAKYMFWFVSNLVSEDEPITDANSGTFYSDMSNIDLKIEDGNPAAVALRTHYAQHSFIEHIDIHIGKGKAGVFDVGNEMEDVRFFGGEYGIYTTKTSPSWQFTMLDTYFEGQRTAAIKTQEAGLTIERMIVKNVPTVISVDPNYWEKLFMEDCQLTNVSGPAIIISDEENANNQFSLRNIDCDKVPVLASYRRSGEQTPGKGKIYRVKNFISGLQIADLGERPEYKTTVDIEELETFPAPAKSDVPQLPLIETWVNVQSLGAKGDGETDNTKIIQDAIDKYQALYFPQGRYRVSETVKLKPNTSLIGLSPIATQLILSDNTPAFGGFGGPKPLLETSKGGDNIVTGIGLSTASYNSRAVACKWMASAHSYMNDVKFIGGHGSMAPVTQSTEQPKPSQPSWRQGWMNAGYMGADPAWDTQYWSLWITDGGGGTFKDIWTASTYATSGVYVSNTSTEGHIYELSVEHHVRNEVQFNKVSNWKVCALQMEEESRESWDCQPVELESCSNMLFANLYLYRVIRIINPYPYAIRTWNCKDIEFLNVHNYTQTKYTTTVPLYDVNTDMDVRPWEFCRLFISGNTLRRELLTDTIGQVQKLATGFEFADGICSDSKGNIYFSETRLRRIYTWSVETNSLSLVCDFPWEPLSLACDKNDNLLVVFKYVPRPGYMVNGKQEAFANPPDAAGTSFSGWGNSGYAVFVYSMEPNNPDESIHMLGKVSMDSIKNIYKALYPANRWRDSHDYNEITMARATECFIAPDSCTIIPICYDLARSNSLVEAFPGKPLYAVDEYDKRTVRLDVSPEGYVSNLKYFAEQGEFNSAVDSAGNVYIADGEIYVYNNYGKWIDEIDVPDRPSTMAFGGKDGKTLFITTRTSLYWVHVKNYE